MQLLTFIGVLIAAPAAMAAQLQQCQPDHSHVNEIPRGCNLGLNPTSTNPNTRLSDHIVVSWNKFNVDGQRMQYIFKNTSPKSKEIIYAFHESKEGKKYQGWAVPPGSTCAGDFAPGTKYITTKCHK